ncbi:MAG: YdcF family protein [Spirulinaceae cyanobacterium RM2_2_10]|nr:YdcF family protein [Spirulinaceae cyanobacterium SM2_1_0]NJO20572.1 YdcF family protein [Spirulinaceae cyanobacterium RM2_2_10]
MFEILTLALLLLILGWFIYWLLVKAIPKAALTVVGGVFILTLLGLVFFIPSYRPTALLWNAAATPLEPLGFSILLLALGARSFTKSAKKPAPGLIWAGLLILIITSTPFLSFHLTRTVEQEAINYEERLRALCTVDCPTTLIQRETTPVTAIVLIAAGTTEANLPYRRQVQLTWQGNVLIYGAALFRRQVAQGAAPPRVIVCADLRPDLQGNDNAQINEAEDIRGVLQLLGVPPPQIILETTGFDIRSHALEVRELMNEIATVEAPISLVTTGLESRRATQAFREVDLSVIPRPAAFYTFEEQATPKRRWRPEDFLPSVQALEMTTAVIHEFWLSLYYFLRGWLFTVGF